MSLTSQEPSTIDKSAEDLSMNDATAPVVRDLTYTQIIFWAAAIGIAGGLVATAYYYLLESSMDLVWLFVPEMLQARFPSEFIVKNYVWIAASIGGMSAALGAFFGAPLGGALFALEIPHRRGLEYYEAIMPAVLAAIMSFIVFRFSTGLSIGGMYHFESIPPMTLMNLLEGAILGAVGAAVALLFVLVFRVVGYLTEPLHHQTILLATLGGLAIGLIALVFPQTLFFGEKQIDTIIEYGATYGIALLLMIGLAKMLAISCTLHSGFRGGFIFPLFYIGSAVGLAISLGFPQIHKGDRYGVFDGSRKCCHHQNPCQHYCDS